MDIERTMTESTHAGMRRGCIHAVLLAFAAGAARAAPADAAGPAVDDSLRETVPAPADDDRPYKSYGAAALEIVAFQAALNRVDHAFVHPDDYGVSVGSVRRNLRSSWEVDRDPFEINQLGHPYQGSVYFGLARSNGLTFWESLGAAFAASAVWEIGGETTPPSRNDQITTSFGGSFLGESLYRMANLVLEQGYGLPPRWREAAAAVASPPLGFNRYVRPGRGATVWNSNSAAVYTRLQLGVGGISHSNVGPSLAARHNEVAADFALDYGLPGKPGYTYRRPFDYFMFRIRLSNIQGIESLASRGMLVGAPYAAGRNLRGIVGLYGSYDYLAPQVFRVASTGLSLGSNAQLWVGDGIALLGHLSGGVGYTSTGTVRASTSGQYNYGFAPQAMATLRVVGGDKVALDLTAREFFDGKLTSPETAGTDRVFRGDASLTYRLAPHHAVTVKYLTSRRTFSFANVPERQQRRDTIGLYYTYQPARGFGAVDW
jgi:hypothetical protein